MFKTETADILSGEILSKADAICFTSNLQVTHQGDLVMGAGVAKQFRDKWPFLPTYFGNGRNNGVKLPLTKLRHYYDVTPPGNVTVIEFPTKVHWKNPSNLELIQQSATLLMEKVNLLGLKNVYLPAPGIGLGQLDWNVVSASIAPILDERITILFYSRK